jgi:hypothetical protein
VEREDGVPEKANKVTSSGSKPGCMKRGSGPWRCALSGPTIDRSWTRQGGEQIDTSIGNWAMTRLRNKIREGFLVLRSA